MNRRLCIDLYLVMNRRLCIDLYCNKDMIKFIGIYGCNVGFTKRHRRLMYVGDVLDQLIFQNRKRC